MTRWLQQIIQMPQYPRGFHLVTREIESQIRELNDFSVGIAMLFMQHTSASLTLNENADPTVRGDFERHFNVMFPEDAGYLRHTYEGLDDMPAHLKSSVLGCSTTIPIKDGRFYLGTWQGVYLCEHRDHAPQRTIVTTIFGEDQDGQ